MSKPKPLTVEQAGEAIKQQIIYYFRQYKEATAGFGDVVDKGESVSEGITIPLKGGGSIEVPRMILTFTPGTLE